MMFQQWAVLLKEDLPEIDPLIELSGRAPTLLALLSRIKSELE